MNKSLLKFIIIQIILLLTNSNLKAMDCAEGLTIYSELSDAGYIVEKKQTGQDYFEYLQSGQEKKANDYLEELKNAIMFGKELVEGSLGKGKSQSSHWVKFEYNGKYYYFIRKKDETDSSDGISFAKSEAIAFNLSKALGLHVVPPTFVQEKNNQEYSYQLKMTGKDGTQVMEIGERVPNNVYNFIFNSTNSELGHIENSRPHNPDINFFDFLINNYDRHSGNILIPEEDIFIDKKPRFYLIDHGASMGVDMKDIEDDRFQREIEYMKGNKKYDTAIDIIPNNDIKANFISLSEKESNWDPLLENLDAEKKNSFLKRVKMIKDAMKKYSQSND